MAYFEAQSQQFPGQNKGNAEKPVRMVGLRADTGTWELLKKKQESLSVVT